jgi:hypothetical protein
MIVVTDYEVPILGFDPTGYAVLYNDDATSIPYSVTTYPFAFYYNSTEPLVFDSIMATSIFVDTDTIGPISLTISIIKNIGVTAT